MQGAARADFQGREDAVKQYRIGVAYSFCCLGTCGYKEEDCPMDVRGICNCNCDSTRCEKCKDAQSVLVNSIPDGYALDGYESDDCSGKSLFSYDNGDEGCNDVPYSSMQLVKQGSYLNSMLFCRGWLLVLAQKHPQCVLLLQMKMMMMHCLWLLVVDLELAYQ